MSEIWIPHSRDKIWLGSFTSAGQAARANDAAVLLLRGNHSSAAFLNFPDSPPDLPTGVTSPRVIQAIAAAVGHAIPSPGTLDLDTVQLLPEPSSDQPLNITAITSLVSDAHHPQLNQPPLPKSDIAVPPISSCQFRSFSPNRPSSIEDQNHIDFDNPFGALAADGFIATSAGVTVSEKFDIDPSPGADSCLWQIALRFVRSRSL